MSNETKKIEDLKEFKDILLNKQRLMGLDLGSKRIGISVSDPELKVAISIKTIERNKLHILTCLLYTSPSPRDATLSRMPSSA